MTAATETLTTELSVDCKDGVLQIEQLEARLGTSAQAAAQATKVNQAYSRSTAEVGAETEKTSAKSRVYENQTRALEVRIASFTARHDPLSKARRDLANAEDLYAKAARRGLEIGENQLRAMDNLRARVEQLSSATDSAARSALSMAKAQAEAARANGAALEGLRLQFDEGYGAQARFAAEQQKVIDLFIAGGINARQLEIYLSKVTQAYDPAVRASREAAEALEREAAARQKVIAAAKAQQAAEDAQGRFNQALGVRPVVTGSASASAAVFMEAEQNAAALETLRRRYDATYAAEARHKEEVAHVMAVTKAANVSDAERAVLLTKVEEAHSGAARSTAAHGQALRLLVPQLNDVFVTAAMGMDPLMIAIQQGPQIIDAFVLGGKEAGAEMLRLAATAAPIALLVGTIAALAAAQESYAGALRETARVNTLTGGSSGFSDAGLEAQAVAAAKAAHTSIASARDVQNAYVATGQIGGRVLDKLTVKTRDYAVATNQDMAAAAQELAGMFSDPGRAAEDAAKRWKIFDDAQVRVIKNLQAQGRLEEAQMRLLDGIGGRTQGAAEKVSIYAKAWHDVETAISDAWTATGRFMQSDQLEKLRAEMEREKKSGGLQTSALGLPMQGVNGLLKGGATDRYWAAVRAADGQEWQALADKADADFKDLQSRAMSFVRGMTPAIALADDFANAQNLMNRAVAAGAISSDQAKQALRAYELQVQQTIDPSKTLVDAINQETQALNLQAGAARNAWTALQQLQRQQPGREIGFDQAAGVQQGVAERSDAQSADRARQVDVLAAAERRLNQARIAGNPREVARATVDLGIAQKQAAGETVNAAEKAALHAQAQRGATAEIDAQVHQLGLQVDAAERAAAAAGKGEAAQRRAAIETQVAAASLKGLGLETRMALEMQEAYVAAGVHAEFAGQIDQEVAANERLVAAMGLGVAAYRDAEIHNKAVAQALKETPPEYDAAGAATGRFSEAISANIALLKKQQGAADSVDLGKYVEKLEDARKDLDFRGSTAGMSSEAKAVAKAQYDTAEALRRQYGEYEKLGPAQQRQWDTAVKLAEENARIEEGVKRQEDAWNQLGQIGERAFDRIGDAVTQLFLEGKNKAISWGSLMKSVAASVAADIAKMGVNDLKRMVGLGGSGGGLSDLFIGVGQRSDAAQQQSGGLGSTGNLLSLGSKFMPSNWTSGLMNSLDTWAYNTLGIGTMATTTSTMMTAGAGGLAANLGVAPMAGGVSNAAVAGSTSATAGSLTGLTSYLGPLGIGAGIGGLLPSLFGVQNKAAGAAIGAGAGAAAGALAGTFLFPGVGTALGALLGGAGGGLGGLLGTNKPKIPAVSAAAGYSGGRVDFRDTGVTGGGSQEAANQAAAALATFLEGFFKVSGAAENYRTIVATEEKGGKYYYRREGQLNGSYGSFDEAALAGLRREYKEGAFTVADSNAAKALAASKATTMEDFLGDVAVAKQFEAVMARWRDGVSASSQALDAMRKAAEELGAQGKAEIVDWRDRVLELGLASESDLAQPLRNAVRAMAGLGAVDEPLAGAAAVAEQVRLNFAALEPVMSAIGMAADEQAAILDEMHARAKAGWDASVHLAKAQADVALALAAGDGAARLSYADALAAAGWDRAAAGVQTLADTLDDVAAAADRGVAAGPAYTAARAQLDDMLAAGRMSAEQYAGAIGMLSAEMRRGATAAQEAFAAAQEASALAARRAVLLDGADAAALLRFDSAATAELRDTADKTGALSAVLAAERAALVFDSAKAAYIAAIEQEIDARRESTDALRAGAQRIAAIAADFAKAAADLRLSERSDLTPQQRLDEARRQFADAVTTMRAAGDDVEARNAAAGEIRRIGEQLTQIAYGYYATTDYGDYRAVLAAYDEFSLVASESADTAAENAAAQIKQNDQVIAQLTQQRQTAERLGQAQLGSMADLGAVMRGAKATLDAMLAQLAARPENITGDEAAKSSVERTLAARGSIWDSFRADGWSSGQIMGDSRWRQTDAALVAGLNGVVDADWLSSQLASANQSGWTPYAAALGQRLQDLTGRSDDAEAAAGFRYAQSVRDAEWNRLAAAGLARDQIFGDSGFAALTAAQEEAAARIDSAELIERLLIENAWGGETVVERQLQARLRQIRGYVTGGVVANGSWNVDSVVARLAGGEHVTRATSVTPATIGVLDHINRTGMLPPPAAQPSPPELAELVKLLRELIALIGAAQAKALAQSGAIGGATLQKLEELIREFEEQTYQSRKAG